MPQPTGKARKLSNVVMLIITCVIPIVGLAYLYIPVPVSNTLTLPVTTTVMWLGGLTHSTTRTYYSVTNSAFIQWCWVAGGVQGFYVCLSPTPIGVPTTSSTIESLIWTVSAIYAFTSTSQTTTTSSTILPPLALHQEGSKAATIIMIALLALGLSYLLFLMNSRKKQRG